RLDVGGAVTVTTSLMLAVYAIVNGNDAGWRSARTLGLLAAAAVLAAVFLLIESRVRNPLMPLRLFRLRNLSTANVVGALWAAAMFAWFFISALYMQLVLGYSAMQIGLAFLPANLIMAAFSLGLSAKLVMRFGIRLPLAAGLALSAAGLALFALSPADGSFALDVPPAMILLGAGWHSKASTSRRAAHLPQGDRTMKVKPIPEDMHSITPHLVCAGAASAIEFYKKAFGATEKGRLPGPDGRLMHAAVRIGDSTVMLVDEMPEWGALGPKALKGSPVTIHLYVDDVDAVVARAVKAGAKVTMPVADQFWGDRYGQLEDPFGHRWSVGTHVRDVSPQEMQKAMQKTPG